MKTRSKKGFTVVELVIVIAVIAILASVLIPTLSGAVKKARQSADETAVANMNTILAADGAVTPTTIYDLFAVLDGNGISAKDYAPLMKGRFFFWDSEANQIVYTDESYNVIYPDDAVKNETAWVSLTGEISTADVKVADLVTGNTAKVDTAAELFAVAKAMNENKLGNVTVIEIANGTYNLMGAELVFANEEGVCNKELTIKADTEAILSGVVNIDAASVKATSNEKLMREYNAGLIPSVANGNFTVTFKNITLKNSYFGGETVTQAAAFVGSIGDATVKFENVKVDNVEIKALSKVGTFAGQVYWNGKMDIDADCAATNVSIETVGGMAGKVFGLLINNATGDTTKVTIADGADIAGDTVTVKLRKLYSIRYVTDSNGVVYASDADVTDGVITVASNETQYYATVAEYGFKGVHKKVSGVASYDAIPGVTGLVNKYNTSVWELANDNGNTPTFSAQ